MKKILILCIGLATVFAASGQKLSKEDMEAKIDTLTQENTALKAQSDSLTKSLMAFQSIYDTLKTNYFNADFTSATTVAKMDSLLNLNTKKLDSLVLANNSLAEQLDTLVNGQANLEAEKAQIITDLRNAKALLDEGILTQEEFNAIKQRYVGKL